MNDMFRALASKLNEGHNVLVICVMRISSDVLRERYRGVKTFTDVAAGEFRVFTPFSI